MSKNNIIIRASAGSGKTFQLSNRYLRFLFAGIPVETILASTFTRKAAGEILDRILGRLVKAATNEDELQKLLTELEVANEFPGKTFDRQFVGRLLADLMRSLTQVRVSTLDSFFAKMAKSFPLELPLPPNRKIAESTEAKALQQEAIRRAIANYSPESEGFKSITQFDASTEKKNDSTQTRPLFDDEKLKAIHRIVQLLSKGEVKSQVTEELSRLAKKSFDIREAPHDHSSNDPWLAFKNSPEFMEARKGRLSKEKLADAIRHYQGQPLPLTAKKVPDSRFQTDVQKIEEQFAAENWDEILSKGIFGGIANDGTYYGKEIPPELRQAALPLIAHASYFVFERIALQTEANAEILDSVYRELEQLKLQTGSIDFSDITYYLTQSQPLWEQQEAVLGRLESQTAHLLLDEFQDTSPDQWKVLRPFAEQAVKSQSNDQTGTVFCVGDVKQAIYGWRGGDSAIFDLVKKELDLKEEKLNRSYRSAQTIIDVVNCLFGQLGANEAFEKDKEKCTDAIDKWNDKEEGYFSTHKTAKTNYFGYCSLEEAPVADENVVDYYKVAFKINNKDSDDSEESDDDSENSQKQNTADQNFVNHCYCVARIKELHEKYPHHSIGVLVRSNDPIGKIIGSLRQVGIDASEEGGTALTTSPAVEIILSALTLADHPGNKIAHFHLLNSPLAETLGLTCSFPSDSVNRETLAMEAQSASRKIREQLFELGVGRLINEWIKCLTPDCNDRDIQKLNHLLVLAHQYQPGRKIRTDHFVNLVRDTSKSSESDAKVRVMTIHGAKGLDFDIVVLPELAMNLIGQTPSYITGRADPDDPTGRIDKALCWVGEGLLPLLPAQFQQMFRDYNTKKVDEAFCVLYVAMTRAKHQLTMIVPPIKSSKSKKDEPPKTTYHKNYAGMLRWALTASQEGVNLAHDGIPQSVHLGESGGKILFQSGDSNWVDQMQSSKGVVTAVHGEKATPTIALLPDQPDQIRYCKRVSPSSLGEKYEVKSYPRKSDIITQNDEVTQDTNQDTTGNDDGKTRGTILHACFEEMFRQTPWLDQGEIDWDALKEKMQERFPENAGIAGYITEHRQLCDKPFFRDLFSLKTYQSPGTLPIQQEMQEPRYSVFPERNFLIRWQNKLLRGIVDRLVIVYNGDKAVGADIIDYKTDRWYNEQNRAHYREQLSAYRDAVCRLYNLTPNQVSCRLLFTTLERIETI